MKLFKKRDLTRKQRRFISNMKIKVNSLYGKMSGHMATWLTDGTIISNTIVGNIATTVTQTVPNIKLRNGNRSYAWKLPPTETYYDNTFTNGYVGINNTTPSAKLHVNTTYREPINDNFDWDTLGTPYYTEQMATPRNRANNNTFNNNTLKTIDMTNTVCNQEHQNVESAVKYLTEKRTEASPVLEINIEKYNKLKDENAELKAQAKVTKELAEAKQDVIRYEESFDGEDAVISYTGKDKAVQSLVDTNTKRDQEIRDLKQQLTILNENASTQATDYLRSQGRFEQKIKESYEDKFEKDNKNLISKHKNTVKDLEYTIDDLNDKIREANDRNMILSDSNKTYRSTLNAILERLTGKAQKWFKRKFDLNAILAATNQYRVTSNKKGYNDMYIAPLTGHLYFG